MRPFQLTRSGRGAALRKNSLAIRNVRVVKEPQAFALQAGDETDELRCPRDVFLPANGDATNRPFRRARDAL